MCGITSSQSELCYYTDVISDRLMCCPPRQILLQLSFKLLFDSEQVFTCTSLPSCSFVIPPFLCFPHPSLSPVCVCFSTRLCVCVQAGVFLYVNLCVCVCACMRVASGMLTHAEKR